MVLFLSLVGVSVPVDPPSGGVSPLAWVIIGALVVALLGICSFSKYWTDRLYKDLKECNEKKAASEEDVLGVLKVLRIQMEQSKGGKQR
jgi:hypothetical protein